MLHVNLLIKLMRLCDPFSVIVHATGIMRGVNGGMQTLRSVPSFRHICLSANIFCLNPKSQPHLETVMYKFKGKLVNVNAIVNFTRTNSKEGNMLDDKSHT